MEEREVLMKDQHDDLQDLQGQCEGRVKDVQGQILILRDVVDNKQDELNTMIQLRAQLQQQLQQVSDLLRMSIYIYIAFTRGVEICHWSALGCICVYVCLLKCFCLVLESQAALS